MLATKPEENLINALDRIRGVSTPFLGIYIAMSKLTPNNRGYRQLEIVSRLFKSLTTTEQSRLFLLSNKDIAFITPKSSLNTVEEILYQIRTLFADDPFLTEKNKTSFQHVFFLDNELDAFKQLVFQKNKESDRILSPSKEINPLSPEILESVVNRLEKLEAIHFIRRQSVLSFHPKFGNHFLFQEFYTSISHLQQKLCPAYSLLAEKSLFFQLTQTLDKQTLLALTHFNLNEYPPAISLNLNISSLYTAVFQELSRVWPTPLIIELQLADIFHNLKTYQDAYKKMHEMGHQILIDGLSPLDLDCLDFSILQPDYLKINWDPEWKKEGKAELLKPYINKTYLTIVLTHCSSEDALMWGQKAGVFSFQGHYVDAILGAMIKNSCTFGQECTLASCMTCRRSLSPQVRSQCVHLKHLDANPKMKAI